MSPLKEFVSKKLDKLKNRMKQKKIDKANEVKVGARRQKDKQKYKEWDNELKRWSKSEEGQGMKKQKSNSGKRGTVFGAVRGTLGKERDQYAYAKD